MDFVNAYRAVSTIQLICHQVSDEGGCVECPFGAKREGEPAKCLIRNSTPNKWNLKRPAEIVRVIEP